MEELKNYIEFVAKVIEAIGVVVIVIGTLMALIRFIFSTQNTESRSYKVLRKEIGKSTLLGLEVLVAGDIISTVVTEPTLNRVLILAIIILIRTFLSISIQMDIEGKFPWQKAENKHL